MEQLRVLLLNLLGIGFRGKIEQNGCIIFFTRHQSTKECWAFSIDWLSIDIHIKLE